MAKIIIRETLKEKGISVKELAQKMDVTSSAISQLLANPNPSILQLEKIAKVIGVDVMDLFAQDYNYINGYFETEGVIYPVKNREQFMGVYEKVDGIVHIPSYNNDGVYEAAVRGFCTRSIADGKSGATMMRYGINEVFTLSYDAESKMFSLTLCIGNGELKFRQFDTIEYQIGDTLSSENINELAQNLLFEIKAVYEKDEQNGEESKE